VRSIFGKRFARLYPEEFVSGGGGVPLPGTIFFVSLFVFFPPPNEECAARVDRSGEEFSLWKKQAGNLRRR